MKKIILLLTYLVVITLIVLSCSGSENETGNLGAVKEKMTALKENKSPMVSDFSKLAGTWNLQCTGECGCHDSFNLNTGVHSCSCSPCVMQIEYIPKGGKSIYSDEEKQEIMQYLLNDYDFMAEFKNYIKSKNSNLETVAIISMAHTFDDNYRFSLITYKDENGVKESVGFYQNGKLAKKYTVDCNGGCGCVEQFTPATGQVSCSCAPCQMTITENP